MRVAELTVTFYVKRMWLFYVCAFGMHFLGWRCFERALGKFCIGIR